MSDKEMVSAPKVTQKQIDQLRDRLASLRGEPLLPVGTKSQCPNCQGEMVTTNDVEEVVATPGLVYVFTRLPGARCASCGSSLVDGSTSAILQARAGSGITADYETSVTRASGKTLGTYFKMDLARVFGLTGDEQLYWKVVSRDRALVQVARRSDRGLSSSKHSRRDATRSPLRDTTPHKRRTAPVEA